ncbi:MAG: IS1595 family transposase [Gammaproteobacteria bacterium]|nr:IS1595 family transposase [Gammaproteobacteria bacterium]MCY4218341.1 IS1595 family transposase [Gammaproteobacteria bacterium]MCY4274027.1 IS1595 family transposase [Gammaproteobacteria bacterium]
MSIDENGLMMTELDAEHLQDEKAAFDFLENIIWPSGPICPNCGVTDNAYTLHGVRTKPSKKFPNGKVRHGLKKCKDCGKQFTIRIGTMFESSHIELHLWLRAINLLSTSNKKISAVQLHQKLGITVKSAWLVGRRIRKAMPRDLP